MKYIDLINNKFTNIQETALFIKGELNNLIDDKTTKIITNGRYGTLLQDFNDFRHKKDFQKYVKTGEKYLVGEFLKFEVYIDPNLRWDDNKIFMYNNDDLIDKIIIKDKK